MKKLLLLLGLVVVLLAGWLVSGPYLTLRGLAGAIEQRDTSQLDRYVDFPMLRANLCAQLLTAGQKLSGTAVDAMVTPTGIGALMEGHTLWKRASNDLESNDAYAAPRAARPLEGATHRFESTSRFTATTHTAQGAPVVFVLQRQGLRWKLVNIELPLD